MIQRTYHDYLEPDEPSNKYSLLRVGKNRFEVGVRL